MERERNMLEKFWKWYVGFGNGGFIGVDGNDDDSGDGEDSGDSDDNSGDDSGDDSQTSEGEDEGIDIGGVKYTQDDEGNYLLNGVAVMDSKKVSFYNRAREMDRKESEHQSELAAIREQHRLSLESATKQTEQHSPEDYDEKTGLTFGQLAELDKRNAGNVSNVMATVDNRIADQQIAGEKFRLQQNPQYKEFFSNTAYVDEMDKELSKLSLQSALMPDIAKQVVSMVQGRHLLEIVKNAEKRARQAALEGREIVNEVSLGGSAGVNTSGKTVTREVIRKAGEMGVSVDSYLEIEAHRKKLKEANK